MTKLRFTLRGFRPPRESLAIALGTLERELMEVIWDRDEVSVREMHAIVAKRSAYTTLMTTLDRLHRKGLLARRKEGRAFVYRARVSRSEFAQTVAKEVIGGMLAEHSEPMVACIVDAVSDHDRALLDTLERLVQEKLATRKGKRS